jgi:signal transduction histidine kinase
MPAGAGDMAVKKSQAAPHPADATLGLSVEQWSTLCAHLEAKLDTERAATARALHDEVGGLLVAAKMDLGHVQRGLRAQNSELSDWLVRAQRSLDAVVAVERRLVEELQPGLLMHIGLFAALRWYVGHLNATRGSGFEADLPPDEPSLSAPQRVALYRAAQEALELGAGTSVRLTAVAARGTLSIAVAPIGVPAEEGWQEDSRFLSVRHRAKSAQGEISMTETSRGMSLSVGIRVSAQ